MGSFSKAFQKVKIADLMSKEAKLNIEGSAGVNTYIGVIFSAIYIVILAAASVYAFRNYFNTSNPISSNQYYYQVEAPKISLAEEKIVPFMIAYDRDGLLVADKIPQYTYIEVAQERWITSADPATNATSISLEQTIMDVVPCSNLTANELAAYSYVKNGTVLYSQMMTNGLCIRANDSFIIEGMNIDPYSSCINYRIKPCILGAQCQPLDALMKFAYYLVFPMTNLNLSNHKEPKVLTSTMNTLFYASPTLFQYYYVYVGSNSISDYEDNSVFMPGWSEKEFFHDIQDTTFSVGNRNQSMITCDPSQVGANGTMDCDSYMEVYIESSLKYQTIKRSYQTIFTTFGIIGGVHNAIFISLFLIYTYYNDKVRSNYLVDQVYPFLQDSFLQSIRLPNQSSKVQPSKGDFETKELQPGFSPKSPVNNGGFATPKMNQKAEGGKPPQLGCLSKVSCCKRKERPENKLRQMAIASIHSSLNIVNLIKELNNLKFLTSILLNQSQLHLVPLLEFTKSYRNQQKAMLASASPQHIMEVIPGQYENSGMLGEAQCKLDHLVEESVNKKLSEILKENPEDQELRTSDEIGLKELFSWKDSFKKQEMHIVSRVDGTIKPFGLSKIKNLAENEGFHQNQYSENKALNNARDDPNHPNPKELQNQEVFNDATLTRSKQQRNLILDQNRKMGIEGFNPSSLGSIRMLRVVETASITQESPQQRGVSPFKQILMKNLLVHKKNNSPSSKN